MSNKSTYFYQTLVDKDDNYEYVFPSTKYKEWLGNLIAALNWEDTTELDLLNAVDYDYKVFYDTYPEDAARLVIGLEVDPRHVEIGYTANNALFTENSCYSGKVHPDYNPLGIIGGRIIYKNSRKWHYQFSQSQLDSGWDISDTYTGLDFYRQVQLKLYYPNGYPVPQSKINTALIRVSGRNSGIRPLISDFW